MKMQLAQKIVSNIQTHFDCWLKSIIFCQDLCWVILVIIMLMVISMIIIWSIFFTCRRRRARQQSMIAEKTMNSKYIFSKLSTKRSKASSLQNGTAQPPVMADNQAASSTGSSCVDSNMISNTSASRSKRSSKRSPSSRAKST